MRKDLLPGGLGRKRVMLTAGAVSALVSVLDGGAPAIAQINREMDWAQDNWRRAQSAAAAPQAARPQQQTRRAASRRESDRAARAQDRPRDTQPATRVSAPLAAPVPAAPAARTVAAAAQPAPARPADSVPQSALRREMPGQAPDPLVAVISLSSQRMQVYNPGGRLMETRVSTGKPGHATPQGIYSIIQRNRHHRSNIYSGAPMPYMQRITWSGIALHAGVVPNHPASHGCIRMPNEFAPKMWALGRMGMRVIVANGDLVPLEISHPALPVPVLTPASVSELQAGVRTAAVGDASSAAEPRLIGPFQLSHVRKQRAARAVAEAEAAVKPAMDRTQEASAAANDAAERLRAQHEKVAALEDRLQDLSQAMSRAQTPDAEAPIKVAIDGANAELAAATARVAELRTAEMAASDAAFTAVKALREAEAAVAAANEGVRLANWGTEPISIFVSRKEGRVFVRQSFNQIHEEAIEIRDPDRPLGTHVFTAMDTADGDAGLKWMAVTMPSTPPEVVEAVRQVRRGRETAQPQPPRAPLPASTAAEALGRFELPEKTRKLIADRLWPGASLIVSDYSASNETGRGTDFIVQPK